MLFSGQDALSPLIQHARSYTAAALVLLIASQVAGLQRLLSGFRGGPIFPSMFIGAAGGIALSHLPGSPAHRRGGDGDRCDERGDAEAATHLRAPSDAHPRGRRPRDAPDHRRGRRGLRRRRAVTRLDPRPAAAPAPAADLMADPKATRLERWLEDRFPGYRYGIVLILLFMTYVFMAAGPTHVVARVVTVGLQGVTLLTTLIASRAGRRLFRIAAVVVRWRSSPRYRRCSSRIDGLPTGCSSP